MIETNTNQHSKGDSMKKWNVFIENTWGIDEYVDEVFYDNGCDAQYVHDGLINHDGYPQNITVSCGDERYPESS
jgi:hypothetical protein